MLEAYERYVALRQLQNLLARPFDRGLVDSLDEELASLAPSLGLASGPKPVAKRTPTGRRREPRPMTPERSVGELRERHRALRAEVATKVARVPTRKGALGSNLDLLAEAVGLDADERLVLDVVSRDVWKTATYVFLEVALDYAQKERAAAISMITGLSRARVVELIDERAPLARCGLVVRDESERDELDMPIPVYRAVAGKKHDREGLERALIGEPVLPTLPLEAFEHLESEVALVRDVLRGALEQKTPGIHVLFYGPPGTGKTELCRAIARSIDAPLFGLDEVGATTRSARIAALRRADAILERRTGRHSLLIFDEMADLLDPAPTQVTGLPRATVLTMLEKMATPVLFTCNDVREFDTAVLRRMTAAIEVRIPPPKVRARIVAHHARSQQLELDDSTIERVAARSRVAPSLLGSAVRAAALATGRASDVERLLDGMTRLVDPTSRRSLAHETVRFDPSLVRASIDLGELTNRLETSGERRFSLCLHGAPGTGKTAFIHHLADRLGFEVLSIRASDLLSKWLGETEQKIAEAFERAKTEGAFLVFDEADSLLRDRRRAERSFEVTQVNEMLTAMETHPLPFACSTNLLADLDSASLRRFTFVVAALTMTREQASRAFERYFDREAPASMAGISDLVPADFAIARRRAELLGILDQSDEVVRVLAELVSARRENSRPIGFKG